MHICASLITLVAILVPTITAQGFQFSCVDVGFTAPGTLSAECTQQDGGQQFTALNLNLCVANLSGNLRFQIKYVLTL